VVRDVLISETWELFIRDNLPMLQAP